MDKKFIPMDFTLKTYHKLIEALQKQGFSFQTFGHYIEDPFPKVVILRHDVDRLPYNSLTIAKLEHQLGVCGSYYFRIVKESCNVEIIRKISDLGHEIGYHYEDLALAKGDKEAALISFQNNLKYFRQIYPVKTICMHGSPLSRWNNLDLWAEHNYRNFGLIGEPYLDMDYSKLFYISDTGRKWNNQNSNIRDKVKAPFHILIQSTFHLISLINLGELPDNIMINTHPQRWFKVGFEWYKELILQNLKNTMKYIMLNTRPTFFMHLK